MKVIKNTARFVFGMAITLFRCILIHSKCLIRSCIPYIEFIGFIEIPHRELIIFGPEIQTPTKTIRKKRIGKRQFSRLISPNSE